jgi:hypothetical protein
VAAILAEQLRLLCPLFAVRRIVYKIPQRPAFGLARLIGRFCRS